MKLCGNDCHPICDFCLNYKDDGRGLWGSEGFYDKTFEGEGVCIKKNIKVDACDICEDDFECFRTKV